MKNTKGRTLKSIQKYIFKTQFCLIFFVIFLIGATAITINIHTQNTRRDENLQSVALTLAHSEILIDNRIADKADYLDALKEKLPSVDVISIINAENLRIYHTNHELIGSVYDGNQPAFSDEELIYASNDKGPSGSQRRVYAAVYGEEGEYLGFVMTVALMDSIRRETAGMVLVYAFVMLAALAIELVLSGFLSKKIRETLNGYEPDVFSAMFRIRDNILESLNEGVVAFDSDGKVQFANKSATRMLQKNNKTLDVISLSGVDMGRDQKNISLCETILLDMVPIREDERIIGSIGILHDRAEYTKLMEDLSGTRYLVDSMRANNHDFTNKLHVILGFIQMEMYDEATAYIENVTIVQRQTISSIMNSVDDPAIAALLIGKNARAAELNIKFSLREGSVYHKEDVSISSANLITVIGNLIDNSFEAMNEEASQKHTQNNLLLGLYSKKGSLLITVDDTGSGISKENINSIYDNGYTTKGEGHGTGLYQVKCLIEQNGGKITVESEYGKGTSFTVTFTEKDHV